MANKAVTTKFQVDISQLTSAMKEAKRAVSLAKSEFKAASSEMEDWGKDSDGLRAKLRQLDTNLAAQEKVLKNYEEVLAQVKEKYGENSKEAQDYQKALYEQQATVNETKKDIKKYETALDEVTKAEKEAAKTGKTVAEVLEDTGEEAKKAEGGFSVLKGAVAEFAGNVLTNLANGLKDAIGYLGTFANSAETAMNSFAAETGASAEEVAEFKDVMLDIYKQNFGESFDDIANAMAEVKKQAGDIGAEELEKLTTNALMMRDTFEFDVNESMRSAQMLMQQFGLSGDEAYNLIAQGAQGGLDKNGDLLDSINEYSVHFAQLGLDAEDMFNMLQNGAKAGTFSVDKLGDAIKEFGIRTKDGSDSTREAFEYLGYDADALFETFNKGGQEAAEMTQMLIDELAGMPDGVEKTTAGVALFGTMWEDLGTQGIQALGMLDGGISTVKNALYEINSVKYDSIGDALSGIKRNLETSILMPIGDTILPKVQELADKFSAWVNDPATQAGIQSLADSLTSFASEALDAVVEGLKWVIDNKDAVIAGLTGIATGFAAFQVAGIIDAVTASFKKFKKANEEATVAQWLLNAAQKANPTMLFVSAIIAVVTALVTFIATNDEAREKVVAAWNAVKEGVGKAIEGIGKFFTETLPNFFRSCIDWLKSNWDTLLLMLVNPFAGLFKYFYENNGKFKEFVDTAIAQIKELPQKIAAWASELVDKAKEMGSKFVSNIVNFFKELPQKLGEFLYSASVAITATLIALPILAFRYAKEFVEKMVEWFKQLPEKISTWLTNAITKVSEWATNMKTKAQETATNFLSAITTFFAELPEKIWTWLEHTIAKVTIWATAMASKAKITATQFLDTVVNFIKELPSKIWTWLQNVVSKVTEWGANLAARGRQAAQELVTAIVDKVANLPHEMLEIGKNIVQGVWEGISGATNWIRNQIEYWVGDVLQFIKEVFGIASPSKLMRDEVGRWIPEGIAVGIDKNAKSVMGAMRNLTMNTVGATRDGLSAVSSGGSAVGGVVNNFYQTINSPKQLNRLEIYRQSKNLLGYAGGMR